MQHVVIIGNGIAGITAARHIRKKSNDKITVISGETDHFFSRTALMYIYMGHMKYEHTKPYEDWFWSKNRIDLKRAWVRSVDFGKKSVEFEGAEHLQYDKLILATGSKSNQFGWEGQDLKGVQGLYSFQDLEQMEAHTKGISQAVVVGGGLIGVEMAEMLHSRGIDVTFLIREKNFWDIVLPTGEAQLIERHLREYHINMRLDEELEKINDDGSGKVKSIATKSGEEIPCQFVGLTVGVSPNVEFLKGSELKIEKGIVVNDFLETNQPDVYAIGDCAQVTNPISGRRSIEAVWYVGRIMGETVAQTIAGTKTAYQPGVWFNSAKFFDIEYQTYGNVDTEESAKQQHFYWEAGDGKKCVNIAYEPGSKTVLGVNTLGIRMRHEVWDKWIRDGAQLKDAVAKLKAANFDPEFFKQYDPEIQAKYNAEFADDKIEVRKRGLLEKLLS